MRRTHLRSAAMLLLGACAEVAAPPVMVDPPSREGWAPETAWPGFTLVAPLKSRRVYLVDMAGEAVHAWETDSKPGASTYLTERGTLLRCQRVIDHPIFQDAGGHGGWLQEIDWNGDVLWDFRWDSEQGLSHHDVEELPNGNVLIIAWDRTTRAAALAAGRDPELLEGQEFWGGAVYEIRPTRPEGGEVVWSWHALDHVIQDLDPGLPNFGDPTQRPERIDINGDRDPPEPEDDAAEHDDDVLEHLAAIGYAGEAGEPSDDEEEEDDPEAAARKARVKGADWMHANGIAYNAELDQIALSIRRYDEVWILDHGISAEEAAGPAGDLLYRWGNPFAYGMGAWEDRQLMGQHHVQWIPEGHLGAGNLIVFNNGARPREHSSIDEWWAPRDANGRYPREPGRPWGPERPAWTYVAEEPTDFHASYISGVQRLPNGNTLICAGAQGWVFEVTPDKATVWDWRSPFVAEADDVEDPNDREDFPTSLFRADRYGPDHPGIVRLREKGAAIPLDPGTGPATNQYEPPPEQDEAGDASDPSPDDGR